MSSAVDRVATQCPQCAAALVYQLGVNDEAGGGFRYTVSCPPCAEIVFEFCTPPTTSAATNKAA